MKHPERRNATNAVLRAKVDQLQALGQSIQEGVAQIESRTLAAVRGTGVTDLPSAALSQEMSPLFQAQRQAMAQMQTQTLGETRTHARSANSDLVSPAELAALLKPDDLS